MMFSKVIFGNATVLKLIFIALGGALGSGIRARDTESEFPLYTTLVGRFALAGTTSGGEVSAESTLLMDDEFTWGIEDGMAAAAPWFISGDDVWITEIEFIAGSQSSSWFDWFGVEQIEYSRRDLRITIRVDHDSQSVKDATQARLTEASFKDTLKTKIDEEYEHLGSRYFMDLTSGVKSFEINSSVPTTTTTTTTPPAADADETETHTEEAAIFSSYATLVGKFTMSDSVTEGAQLLASASFTIPIVRAVNASMPSSDVPSRAVYITAVEFLSSGRRLWWASSSSYDQDLRITIKIDHDTEAARTETETRMTEASFESDFFTHLSIQWLNSTYDIVSITSFELNEAVTSTEGAEEAATMTVVVLIIIAAGVLLCIGGVVVLCARNFCCMAKSSSSLAPSVEVTNVTGDIEMGTNMTSFPSAQPVDIEMGTNIDQVQPTAAPEPVLGEVVAV